MLKYIFAFITLIHGLIHLMGFAKAFDFGNITRITNDISKPAGAIWLITALLFCAAVLLLLLKKESWPLIAIIAAILSQILILTVWNNAKSGTIANVIVLLVAIAAWGNWQFESSFRSDVKSHLQQTTTIQPNLLTEADIQLLPVSVQKYLRYCGVLNKPKVKNIRIVFDGQMRDKGKDWFTFRSVQYNFFDDPTRLFFMKAQLFGVTIPGYHNYQHAKAKMNVKLFGLIAVVNASGNEMNKAETVTVFNDMCLMAPASLVDKRIVWESIDDLSTKATFTNGVNKISATLYFNVAGQLINFISDDRYAISDMKQYRFSTPVKEYTQINGINILKYGEAIWHYPDGEFVYGKFTLKTVDYNMVNFEP
jgi:hypothetical protein